MIDVHEFHSLANIFPLIQGQPYLDLIADVLKNGVREPVWLYEGKILDGRNRWRAAKAAGVKVETRNYEGDDATGFVISLNLHRRHLSESQRAAVAAKLANMGHGGDRRSDQAANLPVVSQASAADMLNVSERSVRAAAKVQQSGVPELAAALDAGGVSVSAAAAVAALPIEQQQQVVAAGPQAVREVAKAVRKTVADEKSVVTAPVNNAAFRALFSLPPIRESSSTDLTIPTMPPQTAITGDDEVDAMLWLQAVVDTGNQALIDKALEAAKRINTPMKTLADRYSEHIMRSGGHIMQAVFATMGFGELEARAGGAIAKAARRHEALSRFGSEAALFCKTPAEEACERALRGLEQVKTKGGWHEFDAAQADARFAAHQLTPHTLADVLYVHDYGAALYSLRHAASPDASDHWPEFQEHEDHAFRMLARIPPRDTAEALAVLDHLEKNGLMDRTETSSILRNLIRGSRE